MGGETRSAVSAWTIDSLKEHVEARLRELERDDQSIRDVSNERDRRYEERFKAMDDKTGLALSASEKAVAKAETATEKRFDAVNEFRGTLSDQASNLMPRLEANARFAALEEKFSALRDEMTRNAGRGEGAGAVTIDRRASTGMVLSLIGGAALLITLAITIARFYGGR